MSVKNQWWNIKSSLRMHQIAGFDFHFCKNFPGEAPRTPANGRGEPPPMPTPARRCRAAPLCGATFPPYFQNISLYFHILGKHCAMASYRQVASHFLNQCWTSSLTTYWWVNALELRLSCTNPSISYGIIRGQWVKSLRPGDTICWYKSELTLVQVMACWRLGPSYLNQCWQIISEVLWQ